MERGLGKEVSNGSIKSEAYVWFKLGTSLGKRISLESVIF